MSFGFGVGDFLAVIQLAKRVGTEFKDAPSQFQALGEEVESLNLVLRKAYQTLPDRDLKENHDDLCRIISGCSSVLEELQTVLDKRQSLSEGDRSLEQKAKRVWHRFKWDQASIDRIRARLTSNISLLNAFLGIQDSTAIAATRAGVERLVKQQQSAQEYGAAQELLNWLSETEYTSEQNDFLSRRQEGTGTWLLDSSEFKEWASGTGQVLYCPGLPGTGKTIMTSVVIGHLQELFEGSETGIAYVYCNFGRQREQRLKDLLASLARQLLAGLSTMPDSAYNLYSRHKTSRSSPSPKEIVDLLRSAVNQYKQSFIVVDALDECQNTDEDRSRLIEELLAIAATTSGNLFATSRAIPEIKQDFADCRTVEIRASREDVEAYVSGQFKKLPSFVARNSELRKDILSTIVDAVDGMFLLAQLHIGSLIGKRSIKALETALKKLPTGSSAFDKLYDEAMHRIEAQVDDRRDLAKDALSWIVCARRRLTKFELVEALAVELDSSELDERNFSEVEDVISACAGLVTIDEQSDIIRLVHYTTQEYFERTWETWFPQAQSYISQVSLTYLSYETFDLERLSRGGVFERLRPYKLYWYCLDNCCWHLSKAEMQLDEQALKLFTDEQKTIIMDKAVRTALDKMYYFPHSTSLHIAAYLGLDQVVSQMLTDGHDANTPDWCEQTPLHRAALGGNVKTTRVLIEQGNVDVNLVDDLGRTALFIAAENGHLDVVKLLLEQPSLIPDLHTKRERTPLLAAVAGDHLGVVKLLLARSDINPNAEATKDYEYARITPLICAAQNGSTALVTELLKRDDIISDYRSSNNISALYAACYAGHEAVVRILLAEKGVSAAALNDHYAEDLETLIHAAIYRSPQSLLELLLEREGVLPDALDKHNCTPFGLAASEGQLSKMRLIHEKHKIDISLPVSIEGDSVQGETPLELAIRKGDYEIVEYLLSLTRKTASSDSIADTRNRLAYLPASNNHPRVLSLLLEKGFTIDSLQGSSQRTPLCYASQNGHAECVELLLKAGAVRTVAMPSTDGKTPLALAAENGHELIVCTLLELQSPEQIDTMDDKQRSPFSLAAESGHEAVCNLLLEHNPDLDLDRLGAEGRSPLSYLAEKGFISLLQQCGVRKDPPDWDLKDSNGRTCLSWAAEAGHTLVVQFLLDKGVDPNAADNTKRTPLAWAATSDRADVVTMLLSTAAVDPNIEDDTGSTPLSTAAAKGKVDIVVLFLEHIPRVDLKCTNNEGLTPLHRAAYGGHDLVAEALLEHRDEFDLNARDSDGMTALAVAAQAGSTAIIGRLLDLDSKIEINAQDNSGRTALCLAVWQGQLESAEVLLERGRGIDANIYDHQGLIALNGLRRPPFAAPNSAQWNTYFAVKEQLERSAGYGRKSSWI